MRNDALSPRTAGASFEITWVHTPTNTSIHYIENDFIELNYLEILGAQYEKIASLIRENVDVITRSEVLEYAAQAQGDEELSKAVNGVIGVASSEFDKEMFAIIERAAASEDESTRFKALVAIGYVEWEECKDILVRFAEHDPNEGMRAKSQRLLKTLQEIWDDPEDYK